MAWTGITITIIQTPKSKPGILHFIILIKFILEIPIGKSSVECSSALVIQCEILELREIRRGRCDLVYYQYHVWQAEALVIYMYTVS